MTLQHYKLHKTEPMLRLVDNDKKLLDYSKEKNI